jgi:hypothetical protein
MWDADVDLPRRHHAGRARRRASALFYEKGLTWRDRFARLAVGVTVSPGSPRGSSPRLCRTLVVQDRARSPSSCRGVGFVFGMIAYKATPGFITSASDG